MKITLVITGGQTGADRGGLIAAHAAGLPTGGFAPQGWRTEDGPAPGLSDYGLKQHKGGYRERTIANVQMVADLTKGTHKPFGALLWFGDPESPGGRLTLSECRRRGIAIEVARQGNGAPLWAAEWLFHEVTVGGMTDLVLMIAGNRESKAPGIAAKVEAFMLQVFKLLQTME